MKFGTWVKPLAVAASAPLRIDVALSEDVADVAAPAAVLHRRIVARLSAGLRVIPYSSMSGPLSSVFPNVRRMLRRSSSQQRRQHFLQTGDQVVGLARALGQLLDLLVFDG